MARCGMTDNHPSMPGSAPSAKGAARTMQLSTNWAVCCYRVACILPSQWAFFEHLQNLNMVWNGREQPSYQVLC
ncbi:hypothetical protein [Paenibacillus bouchesdurhonensis]|uniref:hypothetical protein n=1 Tax=Paenibacillus bouchesdurhonensis TaxID=1870990 RepID=UPI0018FFD874|nr:hypothetical protein [Paenibacillus bouchesdurhonensis]